MGVETAMQKVSYSHAEKGPCNHAEGAISALLCISDVPCCASVQGPAVPYCAMLCLAVPCCAWLCLAVRHTLPECNE